MGINEQIAADSSIPEALKAQLLSPPVKGLFDIDYDKFQNVEEIDGSPRSYMEIPTEWGRLRITYRTLSIMSKDKDAIEKASIEYVNAVRTALNNIEGGGIIWWRRRPEIEFEGQGELRFKLYCRLETLPKLSEEFWDQLPVILDGERAHTLGESWKPLRERQLISWRQRTNAA